MKTTIALHGFLGLPSDWDHFTCTPYAIKPSRSPVYWAAEFNEWVLENTTGPRILMGYSMGGRLALHALIQNPSLWQEAIIISANIGLIDLGSRLQNDAAWATKFRCEPWGKLMQEWEAQNIFKDSFVIPRNEEDYNREDLAKCLENFSLAKQEYLLPAITKLAIPIQWITGALDISAETHAKDVIKYHPLSSHLSIPNGTHRVHFEFPEILSQILRSKNAKYSESTENTRALL